MAPSLLIAWVEGASDFLSFLISVLVTAVVGLALVIIKPNSLQIGHKEGFIVATLGWVLLAVFGGLPFLISGVLVNPVDAFFETMSGLTTTGSTVIKDVEVVPHGILFWRSFTHWLGGMGVIVLTLALIPSLKIAGFQLFKAEVPGPNKSKVLPRVAQTSRQLYKLYLGITIANIIALKLAGVSWFNSFIHAFGAVGTGGFSSYNASVAAFNSPLVELILVFFMLVCGINFSLYFYVLKGRPLVLFKDTETRAFLGIISMAVILIAINLTNVTHIKVIESLRLALFQVVTIITSTGYATTDFNLWPDFSRIILVAIMFVGACAGSTGGGIKVIRFVILYRSAKRQILKLVHPQAVVPLRIGQNVIAQEVVQMAQNFFILYLFILAIVTMFITSFGIDIISAFTATVTSLSNVGPGLGIVGPATTYAILPTPVKAVLAVCMLIGRLEIYTVLALFSAKSWR
jgi:trk system potassium uptake protein TrkH